MIQDLDIDKLPQGYYTQSGTVLQRRDTVKNGQSLLLFLRDLGPRWVSAPSGSAKNRFGGAVEPMVWGTYSLYQSPNRLYLQGAEVKEDFLSLRSSPDKLNAALGFYKKVLKVLMNSHASNDVLTLLWSCMLLLGEDIDSSAAEFRFTWRLLNLAGCAPSLQHCVLCGARLIKGKSYWNNDGGICCDNCSLGVAQEAVPLCDLQYAALLSHENFIKWSLKTEHKNLYKEYTGKLLNYFDML